MNDHDLVLAIVEILDGKEWHAGTPSEIATLLEDAGYTINSYDPE